MKKTFIACVCMVLSAPAAFAGTCTILPGMGGKWSEGTSWKEGTAPQAGDAVIIDATETAAKGIIIEATKADIDFLETTGVGNIVFANVGSTARNPVLQVTVGPNELVTYSGVITNTPRTDSYSGCLVKKGEGHLQLTHDRGNYHLEIVMQVDEGVLQLPSVDNVYRNQHYVKFVVNSPGALWTLTGTENNSARAYLHDGVAGDGVVTNSSPKYATTLELQTSKSSQRTFSGILAGDVRIIVDEQRGHNFISPESPTTGSTHTLSANAELGLASIGGTTGSDSNVGSLGKGSFDLDDKTTIRYLGAGEQSYATFTALAAAQSFTLNGGPNGGYEHRGTVNFSASTDAHPFLVLDGTNRMACTLSSAITRGKSAAVGLVKRGCGTWNATKNANSKLGGVVTVEDGTLTFDTLAEKDDLCALGWASGCADYAVVLGTDSSTGTLASASSTALGVGSRTIALQGDGRLSSGSAPLEWMGVKAIASGIHTLTLDGTAAGSYLGEVQDGDGQVAIAKEGSGSWTLGGTLGFTGGIDVRSGTLTVSAATNYYRYFRINFKERAFALGAGSDSHNDISRWGLFDANGGFAALNAGINLAACGNIALLQPGEATFYSRRPNMDYSKIVNSSGSAEALFKREGGSTSWWRFHDSSYSAADLKLAPWIDRPESWFSVVVRLPEAAKNVYSYDLGDRWKRDHNYAKYQFQTWSIDASVDGLVWREVSSVVSNLPNTVNHNVWRKGGNSLASPSDTRWKISPGIIPENTLSAGLDWISVAAGATLTSDTCVTARKIVVEATGGGAVSGFRLADDGVIDVVGVPAKGAFEVALDLSQVELPDGVPILVNGQEDRREVTLSADRKSIRGIPSGLMILVE